MTLPVHIPHGSPDLKAMTEDRHGGLQYRLLIDADGGPSSDLCQGIYYLQENHAESPHRHNVSETIYVLKGNGRAILGDQTIELSEGDTLFIPAGQVHEFEADAMMEMMFTYPVDRFADVDHAFDEAA